MKKKFEMKKIQIKKKFEIKKNSNKRKIFQQKELF